MSNGKSLGLSPAASKGFDFDLANALVFSPQETFGAETGSPMHLEPTSIAQETSGNGYHRQLGRNLHTLPTNDATNSAPSFDLDMEAVMAGLGDDFIFQQMAQQQALGSIEDLPFDSPFASMDAFRADFPGPAELSTPQLLREGTGEAPSRRKDRSHLPTVLKEKSERPASLLLDESDFQSVCEDAYRRLNTTQADLPIKNHRELQHFINGYLTCFHPHLPFLHLPSLVVKNMPCPLIFALCCIGSLYRLDRLRARKLYEITNLLLNNERESLQDERPESSYASPPNGGTDLTQPTEAEPLSSMQARTLLLLYAMLGEDSKIVNAELGKVVMFVIVSEQQELYAHMIALTCVRIIG